MSERYFIDWHNRTHGTGSKHFGPTEDTKFQSLEEAKEYAISESKKPQIWDVEYEYGVLYSLK